MDRIPDFIPERTESQVESWLQESKADTNEHGSRLFAKRIWFASERFGSFETIDYYSACAVCRFRLCGGRADVTSYLERNNEIEMVSKSTFKKHCPADLRTPIQGGSALEAFWMVDVDYYKMPDQLTVIAGFPQSGNYHPDLFRLIVGELIRAGYKH